MRSKPPTLRLGKIGAAALVRHYSQWFACLFVLMAVAGGASAAPVYTITSVTEKLSGDYAFAQSFSVSQAENMTEVGYFDPTGAGFAGTHTIGLYDSDATHTLLFSVTLNTGTTDTLVNFFRFRNITPYELIAGHTYTIVGTTTSADNWSTTAKDRVLGFAVTDPLVTLVHPSQYANGSSLVYPTTSGFDGEIYIGPNFMLSPIPEPATMALFGLGAMALGAMRRRARSFGNRPAVSIALRLVRRHAPP
jgi:hypothetical protein